MKKILLTGHRGFLGRELIPHLEYQGHIVYTNDLDYCDKIALDKFISNKKINFILHAAIRGGRRTKKDTSEEFYNNILMFENLLSYDIPIINFCSGAVYGRNRSLDGVKEEQFGEATPTDYYGLSKYIISHRCRSKDNIYNLRLFAVFGPEEPYGRFIKNNIKNYVNKTDIIIFKDKYMSFFGIEDTKKVIDYFLLNHKTCPRELNLVYQERTSLTDVAELINTLSHHKVNIFKKEEGWDSNYYGCGKVLGSLNINLNGLFEELRNCYTTINT
jgi:GDP-L-fucose synthase